MNKETKPKATWRITFFVVAASVVLSFLACFMREMYIQATLGPKVESGIGCKISSPYFKAGTKYVERLAITDIVPGGPCEKAGFVEGDIIMIDLTGAGLYQLLSGSPGSKVVLTVVPGGDGAPLDERPRREVTVVLP